MDLSQEEWTLKQNEIKDSIILDVRTTEEYNDYHLKQATHLPLKSIYLNHNSLDFEKTIYFICQSGVRSLEALRFLKKTYNLAGGIIEWEGETE